jgi:hypothetical protein
MKKQLGILAGSVMLASSAQALVTSNAVAVFNTAGQGSFIIDTGVSADDLASGTGFSIDVSAAIAGLGGSIDSYAVLGLTSATATGLYNYDSGSYVDVGAGVVYASSTGGPALSQNNTALTTGLVATYLGNASFGANAEGTAGDADGSAAITTGFGGLLNAAGAVTGIFVQDSDFTGASSSPDAVAITSPAAGAGGVSLEGATFSATAPGAVIPVPAAAWLFGSALVGLGVVRRK